MDIVSSSLVLRFSHCFPITLETALLLMECSYCCEVCQGLTKEAWLHQQRLGIGALFAFWQDRTNIYLINMEQ